MSIYSIIYIFIAAVLLIYTLKNRLDLLCVSAVCFVVYSMYCLYGYGKSGFYRPSLSPMLYYCVYVQMFIILLFSVVVNYINRKRRSEVHLELAAEPKPVKTTNKYLDWSFYAYTAVICLFALVNIASVGISGFAAGKANVWNNTNVLYIVSLYGAYPSFAYGIHNGKKLMWIPSLLIEMTIFFAGSRAFVTTMAVIFLCEKGTEFWNKYKGNIKMYALGGAGIVFLLVYRAVDESIMKGDMGAVVATLSNPTTWTKALEFNEPRVIIANYDYVLTQHFKLPLGDIIYRLIDFVPGTTSIFPIRLKYPEYFSTWLEQEVHGSAGVGGTIWGESYAMFGVFGILLFTCIWLFFIKTCSKHLDYHKPYSYFLVSVGAYLAWYINRLDFNRVAQSLKVTLLCFLIWAALYLIFSGSIKIGKKTEVHLWPK